MKTQFLGLLILLMLWQPSISLATAGFAEWALLTPGEHQIAHKDPFLANNGTCLLAKSKPKQPIVSHIQWWRYYPTHVAGKAGKGFFLFNESSEQLDYFETEAALEAKIKALSLEPLDKRLTPTEGWNQVWGKILKLPLPACVIVEVTEVASWQRCQNKPITVTGTRTPPEQVVQHPMLIVPASMGLPVQQAFKFQDYLNIGYYQVILLTKQEISCADKMEVKGKLRHFALGGQQGTKNEYQNWVIEVDEFRCLEK